MNVNASIFIERINGYIPRYDEVLLTSTHSMYCTFINRLTISLLMFPLPFGYSKITDILYAN